MNHFIEDVEHVILVLTEMQHIANISERLEDGINLCESYWVKPGELKQIPESITELDVRPFYIGFKSWNSINSKEAERYCNDIKEATKKRIYREFEHDESIIWSII